MKVMISQPMRGKTKEEILKIRSKIIEDTSLEKNEILNNLFDFENKSPLYYLAKSLEAMSEADLVLFTHDWEQARGCRIEYEAAKAYGKMIMILPSED